MARRSKYAKDYDLFAYAEDNRPSIVYRARNILNGKIYIGMTRLTLERRRGQHIASAKRHGDRWSILHAAIRKYGEAAFHFEIIAECASYKDAALEEIRLIAELKPEYNLGMGGEAVPNVGFRPTKASREATRKRMKGKPGYWTGKKRPDIAEKQRARLTANPPRYMLGKTQSEASRAKMSATKKSRGVSALQLEAMKKRRKAVVCLDDGRVFSCCKEAAAAIGCRPDSLLRVLIGRRPHVFGYRFQYESAP